MGIFVRGFVLGLLSLLVACPGQGGEGRVDNGAEAFIEAIQGTWIGRCWLFVPGEAYRDDLEITGDDWVTSSRHYYNESCSGAPHDTMISTAVVSVGGWTTSDGGQAAHEVDVYSVDYGTTLYGIAALQNGTLYRWNYDGEHSGDSPEQRWKELDYYFPFSRP